MFKIKQNAASGFSDRGNTVLFLSPGCLYASLFDNHPGAQISIIYFGFLRTKFWILHLLLKTLFATSYFKTELHLIFFDHCGGIHPDEERLEQQMYGLSSCYSNGGTTFIRR